MEGYEDMTNYEKIKKMSVEEMALVLSGRSEEIPNCVLNAPHCLEGNCTNCFKKWLNNESENDTKNIDLKNIIKLKKTILENPQLSLVITDNCYSESSVGDVEIKEVSYIKDEDVWMDKNEYEQYLCDIYDASEQEGFENESDLQKYLDNITSKYEFTKSIVLYIQED